NLPATAGVRISEVMSNPCGAGALAREKQIEAEEIYELLLRNARNKAAVRSSGRASARIVGFTPLFVSAARSASSWYAVFRLFQSVLRFCPKHCFRKAMNSASGTRSASSFGLIVILTTLECTFGGGENAAGGSVNSFSIRP